MPRVVYSFSPADLPKPTTLADVDRDLFEERDIRRERNLARLRPGAQASRKSHEMYLEELEGKLR